MYIYICIYSERFLETYVSRWLQIFARECERRPLRGAGVRRPPPWQPVGRRRRQLRGIARRRRTCLPLRSRGFGRSVGSWFIALETCRLYLHVKRVTHLLPFAWLDYSSEWCGEPHFPTSTRENWERSGYNYIKRVLKESRRRRRRAGRSLHFRPRARRPLYLVYSLSGRNSSDVAARVRPRWRATRGRAKRVSFSVQKDGTRKVRERGERGAEG